MVWFSLISIVFSACVWNTSGLMFHSYLVLAQWDTWGYYNNETNEMYAYYLVRGPGAGSPGEGFGLAISNDTVHWVDYGLIFTNPYYNTSWEGTSMIWKNPKYNSSMNSSFKYIINYSNCPYTNENIQNISFAVSNDLIDWKPLTTDWFNINTYYYSIPGRWDCMFPFTNTADKTDNYIYAAWTATPNSKYTNLTNGANSSMWGYGRSIDGLTWEALPSPTIIYSNSGITPWIGELGAIESFLLPNGTVLFIGIVDDGAPMAAFYATNINGPYYPQSKNFIVLDGDMFFARFTIFENIILVTHQSVTNEQENGNTVCYIGLYKRAVVDDEGILRLGYWEENENMKGEELNLKWINGSNETLIDLSEIKPITGVFIEGIINLTSNYSNSYSYNYSIGSDKLPGIMIGKDNGYFSCIVINAGNGDVMYSGMMKNISENATCPVDKGDIVNRDVDLRNVSSSQFKLILRQNMFEFYFNGLIYFVKTLDANQTGIIGRIPLTKKYVQFTNAWATTLYANVTSKPLPS